MATNEELTIKQENFCRYYIDTDGCASEAYRMAYNTANMKPESVNRLAYALVHNVKIASRIAELRAERAKASEVRRENVERVLLDIVMCDPKDMYIRDDNTGKLRMKDPAQMPKRLRNSLKSIKNSRGQVTYKFNGKTEAARLLGAWNGWDAPQQVNVQSMHGGEIRIGFGDNEDED